MGNWRNGERRRKFITWKTVTAFTHMMKVTIKASNKRVLLRAGRVIRSGATWKFSCSHETEQKWGKVKSGAPEERRRKVLVVPSPRYLHVIYVATREKGVFHMIRRRKNLQTEDYSHNSGSNWPVCRILRPKSGNACVRACAFFRKGWVVIRFFFVLYR